MFTVYRTSFCQTYAEMAAPTGEWKGVLADNLFLVGLCLIYTVWMDQTGKVPLNNFSKHAPETKPTVTVVFLLRMLQSKAETFT